MPRYRTENGVVVNIPVALAARMKGLVPFSVPPVAPAVPAKRPYKRKSPSTSES